MNVKAEKNVSLLTFQAHFYLSTTRRDWYLCCCYKKSTNAMQHVLNEDKREHPQLNWRNYTPYSDKQRAKRGKYAAKNRNIAARRKFESEIPNLGESTLWFFKKFYLNKLRVSAGPPATTITHRKCGRLLILGKIDEEVLQFHRALRKAGTPKNTADTCCCQGDCLFKILNVACWAWRTHQAHKGLGSFHYGEDGEEEVHKAPGIDTN